MILEFKTKVELWFEGYRIIKCNGSCGKKYWVKKIWHKGFKCNNCDYK